MLLMSEATLHRGGKEHARGYSNIGLLPFCCGVNFICGVSILNLSCCKKIDPEIFLANTLGYQKYAPPRSRRNGA